MDSPGGRSDAGMLDVYKRQVYVPFCCVTALRTILVAVSFSVSAAPGTPAPEGSLTVTLTDPAVSDWPHAVRLSKLLSLIHI